MKRERWMDSQTETKIRREYDREEMRERRERQKDRERERKRERQRECFAVLVKTLAKLLGGNGGAGDSSKFPDAEFLDMAMVVRG